MRKLGALLLALALLANLTACGGDEKSDDPNVGKWTAISASMMGIDMEVDELFESGVTLELKANGRFEINVGGEKGNGKWEYDGNTLKFTASDADMTGAIKGDTLTLTNLLGMGIDITFEKEGGYSGGQAESGQSASSDAGYYVIDTIIEDGESFGSELLKELGIAYYILLNEDGTAQISTDSWVEGAWIPGKLQYKEDGEDVVSPYTLDKDMLTIELDGGDIKLVFKRSDGAPPAQAAQAPGRASSADDQNVLQQWWNGDWYGYIYLPTADGAWKELEDGYWDCFATIDSDASGNGNIYLWDDGGELGNVSLQITEHGVSSAGVAMSESGFFNQMMIGHADWIIDPGTNTQPYEHLIIIDGTFEDPDGEEYGGFMYEVWLRPWGMLWDDAAEEDQPPGYYDWYLDRFTGPMPTMSEFLSGTDPQAGADGSAGSGLDIAIDPGDIKITAGGDDYGEDGWLTTTTGTLKMQIPDGWEVATLQSEASIGTRSAPWDNDFIGIYINEYSTMLAKKDRAHTPENQAKENAGDDPIIKAKWGNTDVWYRIEDVDGRDTAYVFGFAAYNDTHFIKFDIRARRDNGTLEDFMKSDAWKTLTTTFELTLP